MALVTEQALKNLMNKTTKRGTFSKERYTGFYIEDEVTKERKYVVLSKTIGGNEAGAGPTKRQERRVVRKGGWWPESKKIEAATLHAAMGNMSRVSELSKVPVGTLRQWAEQDWWTSVQARVKRESNEEMDTKFSSVVDKALNKIEKAVQEGDYLYDIKKGVLVKVPMTGRDLAIVAGTMFDKRQLLRNEPTRITKTQDTEKHLLELAEKFKAMIAKKEEKVIEGTSTVVNETNV